MPKSSERVMALARQWKMTAQQLIEQLQRIVYEYGPDVIVEARNGAGDMNPLEVLSSVQVGVGWGGVTTVWLDPSAE